MLRRTEHHLKAVVRRLDMSDMDLKTQSDDTRKRLDKLHCRSDAVLQEERAKLDTKADELATILRGLLGSESGREALTTCWLEREVPDVELGLGNWKWVKERIQTFFFDRVMDYVESWERQEEVVAGLEAEIACQLKLQLQLLHEELESIEREINGESSSESSDGLSPLSRTRRNSANLNASLTPTKMMFMLGKPRLPMKMMGRIKKPFKAVIEPLKNKMRLNEFKAHPIQVAEKLACEMYEELLSSQEGCDSESPLMVVANFFMDRPRDYLDAIERKIPDMILSNQLLLNRVQERIEVERQHHDLYVETMTSVETLRKSLREYGEGYIFVEDFNRGELQILRQSPEGDSQSVAFNVHDFMRGSSGDMDVSRRRDVRGLWTVTYSGCLVRDGLERSVAIRVYLPSSGVQFTFKEVAKLR